MKTGIANILAILIMTVLIPAAYAQKLVLPQREGDPVVLRGIEGPPEDNALKVYVKGAETPIAGRYAGVENALHFVPAFGFEPGKDYVAKIEGGARNEIAFRIADQRAAVPAAVTKVYPSGDTLPENTLRFYLHFSVPMQPQVAFDYIKLRDASGTVDDAAFMRFKQELWNHDRTRLTVLVDPGRIKRDVATNVELGPALLAGRRYTLEVEGGWPSADGSSVLPKFSKSFTVSDALRVLPDPGLWRASTPCFGTNAPLNLWFDRPFDRHLLSKDIEITTTDGVPIPGTVRVGAGETTWTFVPDAAWRQNMVHVSPRHALEDVAGNNFRDLLDNARATEDAGTTVSGLSVALSKCGNQ